MTKYCPFVKSQYFPDGPVKNVKTAFGANNLAGDGSDEHVKIAAVYAAASVGDVLFWPTGVYYGGTTRITPKAGVHNRGEGSGAWLKALLNPGSSAYWLDMKLGKDERFSFGTSQVLSQYLNMRNITFIGETFFAGSRSVDGALQDSVFNNCHWLTPTTYSGNCMSLFVYGTRAGNVPKNLDFNNCTWDGDAR